MHMHEARHLYEVAELDRDCELGQKGERAVVIELSGRYMTVLFPGRPRETRLAFTGSDYRYLRSVP